MNGSNARAGQTGGQVVAIGAILGGVSAELAQRGRAVGPPLQEQGRRLGGLPSMAPVLGSDTPDPARDEGTKESRGIAESIQYQLFGQLGGIEIRRIRPQSEFPTALTRVPIFPPGTRAEQRGLLDASCALCFETPWGRGKRYGPPLTTADEDTLLALLRLRKFALRANGSRLPVPLPDDGQPKMVHALYLRICDVQRELGVQVSGQANALRLESIKRLAATRIELEILGADGFTAGKTHSLLEVEWASDRTNGLILVQFPPAISQLLESAYSYVDWGVRRELSESGKAIHRFLSGQGKSYVIGADKLRTTIGYTRSISSFMRDLRTTMEKLRSLGWLKGYGISGSGRGTPFTLKIVR